MMEEREPQWYEQARRGPFESAKFTDAHADEVMRRVKEGKPHRKRRGVKFRARIAAVAGIFLLVGAGALYLGAGPFGEGNTFGLFHRNEDTADLTESGMKRTAEKLMQERLGKKLPYEGIKPEPGAADQVCLTFREGEYYALIWVSKETGKVTMYSMEASYGPGEIEDDIVGKAKDKLQELGYKGEFKPYEQIRTVNFGRIPKLAEQISENLFSDEARILYVNGEYYGADFEVSLNEVDAELKQTGLHALSNLRSGVTDRLSKAVRHLGKEMEEEITLFYGPYLYVSPYVTMVSAARTVLAVEDHSLATPDPGSPEERSRQDKLLLEMDETQLQNAAAAAADPIFGIRLKEYTLVKQQQNPGTVTFESGGKASPIDASYNLEGVLYRLVWREAPY